MSLEFKSFSLSHELLATLEELKYTSMTPIQAASIPLLLAGQDLVGRSQTGSGKTAAYALPILQKLFDQPMPQALILCPTRELCEQVLQEVKKFSKRLKNVRSVALVGGQPYPPQIHALELGAQVVVGTPGRVLELLRSDRLDVRDLKTLVLDEADKMLDEGFFDEVSEIIDNLPKVRQTVFFSATYPEAVDQLSRKYQHNPQTVTIETEPETQPSIEQYAYEVENPDKLSGLIRILQQHPSDSTLIFCRTKDSVREISETLAKFKIPSRELHGDLEQPARDQAMFLFRNGSLRILVATDVAARGLDVDHLELVVNYDLPINADVYLHRIGRTGRAGKSGVAVSMANEYEGAKVFEIEKAAKCKIIRGQLGFKNQLGLGKAFQTPKMKTIMISGGKKDKVGRGDILGALTAKPQALQSADIGKIELLERSSFVAVTFSKANEALKKLQNSKIKGSKFKIYFIEP